MKKALLGLFVVASAGELVSTVTNLPRLHIISKPFIIPLLAAFYIADRRSSGNVISVTLLLALSFSWIGDVLLMKSGEIFFMLGLVSFLMAHVLYIFAYRQHRNEDSSRSLQGLQRIRFAFPVVLSGTGLVVILYPHLGEMRGPVLIYAVVLTVMVLNALFRFGRTNTTSFSLVFAGAILFMISDSFLAINKFLEPISFSGFWIMTAYISAQYWIVRGLVKHS